MRKLTYEFVKERFEKENYILLNTEYINSRLKLKYICPNGHKHGITWKDFKSGRRCYYCGLEKGGKKRRLNFDFVKESFENEGYIVLTKRYKNCEKKLDYICPKGHTHSISWHNWKNGWRCPFCHYEKLSILFTGNYHPNWKGGISCEPYCDVWLDKDFKQSIKDRDGNRCLNPDCFGNIHRLSVHHIDYNKKNCDPSNLITLCTSCNSRANKDREWHTDWYKAIIEKRMIRRN